MPVLSCINAARRDGIGWLSKCALTLCRCSTVMGGAPWCATTHPRH
jgi:hypothetical protein